MNVEHEGARDRGLHAHGEAQRGVADVARLEEAHVGNVILLQRFDLARFAQARDLEGVGDEGVHLS